MVMGGGEFSDRKYVELIAIVLCVRMGCLRSGRPHLLAPVGHLSPCS